MSNPADLSVLIFSTNMSIARTMRMALRGMGVRAIHLASDEGGIFEGFSTTDPRAVIVYVDGPENDAGLDIIRFLRRDDRSPNKQVPIVAASQRRDVETVKAVINAGGHEYVLFPASGDSLVKKILAARNSNKPWIETDDYVGPARKQDEPAKTAEQAAS